MCSFSHELQKCMCVSVYARAYRGQAHTCLKYLPILALICILCTCGYSKQTCYCVALLPEMPYGAVDIHMFEALIILLLITSVQEVMNNKSLDRQKSTYLSGLFRLLQCKIARKYLQLPFVTK